MIAKVKIAIVTGGAQSLPYKFPCLRGRCPPGDGLLPCRDARYWARYRTLPGQGWL